LQSPFPDSPRREINHLRRWIKGKNFHSALSQVARVYTRTATDFQHAIATFEDFRQFAPHRGALRRAYGR
jgi:hypothetical protein